MVVGVNYSFVDCVLVKKIKQYQVEAKFIEGTQTVKKWVKHFKEEGDLSLENRSSRPHKSPSTNSIEKVEEIVNVGKEGKQTGDHIARKLNMHQGTVIRHLIRDKLSRKKDIEDRDEEPPRRYEHEALGDMIHLDIKKLRNLNEEGV